MSSIGYFHLPEYSNGELKVMATGAYILNSRTGQLRYGATIFKREKPGDQWSRSKHLATAKQRLQENPVVIEFGTIEYDQFGSPEFYQFRRLEHFIRKVCMPLFGTEYHVNRDPYRNTQFQNSLQVIKDRLFTQSLTDRELEENGAYAKRADSQNEQFAVETNADENSSFGYGIGVGISISYLVALVLISFIKSRFVCERIDN